MNKIVEAQGLPYQSKDKFDIFWSSYPKRKGQNPRAPAEKKFAAAVKNGANPDHLIASARRYGDELREQHKLDTEFVCMASTWLNQQRWLSYAYDPDEKERQSKIDADMAARGYKWNGERWEEIKKAAPAELPPWDAA